jgi:hypothetical protein
VSDLELLAVESKEIIGVSPDVIEERTDMLRTLKCEKLVHCGELLCHFLYRVRQPLALVLLERSEKQVVHLVMFDFDMGEVTSFVTSVL